MARLAAAAAAAAALTAAAGCSSEESAGACAEPVAPVSGHRLLFDGTAASLDGWAQAGPGSLELQDDCTLATVGGLGLLWYEREALAAPYVLRVEWRAEGDSNSGVFVGFPPPGDDPLAAVEGGYEVQIDAADEAGWTTGAIYGFQPPDAAARDAALAPAGEWNVFEIEVAPPRIAVRLNGAVVNVFESTDPARAGLARGHVGLQNHGDADTVLFRSVQVRAGAR